MGDPRIKADSHVCNGQQQHVFVGFKPDIVFAKLEDGSNSTPWFWWTTTSWCGKSQPMNDENSVQQAIMGVDQMGFLLGTDAQANVDGKTLHWLALADNGSGKIRNTGWMGSPAAWSPVVGDVAPDAVFVKRDNNQPPVFRCTGMSQTIAFTGVGTVADAINSLNSDGTISIGTHASVNQLTGPSTGEGTDCIAINEVPGLIDLVSWSGDNSTGKLYAHGIDDPVAVIVLAEGTQIGALKTATMGTKVAIADQSAMVDNRIASLSGGILIGSDNEYNESGTTYRALVFGRSDGLVHREYPKVSATAKSIKLRGSNTSNIDCGTDNSLSLSGAFTLEWWGFPRRQNNNNPVYLLARSDRDEGRADSDGLANGSGTRLDGHWSFGLYVFRHNDLGDWPGPQFCGVVTNYNMYASSAEGRVETYAWRTGVCQPHEPFHAMLDHDGSGGWCFTLNDKLMKQRKIDMTSITLSDDAGQRVNAGAGIGHRTVIGARQGTSSIANLLKGDVGGAAIYGSKLSAAEKTRLYRRHFLNDDTAADVTPLERWRAENVSGGVLLAEINSANNGIITNGVQIARPF